MRSPAAKTPHAAGRTAPPGVPAGGSIEQSVKFLEEKKQLSNHTQGTFTLAWYHVVCGCLHRRTTRFQGYHFSCARDEQLKGESGSRRRS